MSKLANQQHESFCRHYVVHHNAARAARQAGYSFHTASEQSAALLGRVDIMVRVGELFDEKMKPIEHEIMSAQEVLAEMSRIARADRRNLVDSEGNAKLLSDLDDDTAALIDGYEQEETSDLRNGTATKKSKFKLVGRLAALDKLAQHHNAYEKHERNKSPVINVTIAGKDSDL